MSPPDDLPATLGAAEIGHEYVTIPWIAPADRRTVDDGKLAQEAGVHHQFVEIRSAGGPEIVDPFEPRISRGTEQLSRQAPLRRPGASFIGCG